MNENELRRKLEALVEEREWAADLLAPQGVLPPANDPNFAIGGCLWRRASEVRKLLADTSAPSTEL